LTRLIFGIAHRRFGGFLGGAGQLRQLSPCEIAGSREMRAAIDTTVVRAARRLKVQVRHSQGRLRKFARRACVVVLMRANGKAGA